MRTSWRVVALLYVVLAFVVGARCAPAAGADTKPDLLSALAHLEAAIGTLHKAPRDHAGHRAKAIELTNQAIEELKLSLQPDQRRSGLGL